MMRIAPPTPAPTPAPIAVELLLDPELLEVEEDEALEDVAVEVWVLEYASPIIVIVYG